MRQARVVDPRSVCHAPLQCLNVVVDCGPRGFVQVSVPEHCVTESKPDSTIDDLRCDMRNLKQHG